MAKHDQIDLGWSMKLQSSDHLLVLFAFHFKILLGKSNRLLMEEKGAQEGLEERKKKEKRKTKKKRKDEWKEKEKEKERKRKRGIEATCNAVSFWPRYDIWAINKK